MSIKPPPAPFDAAADHDRYLDSIERLAKDLRAGHREGSLLLHQIGRLALVEQTLKTLAVDGEFKRPGVNTNDLDAGCLFPAYRSFLDVRAGHEIRLIVQDLHAVWNGAEFEGDGSCTLNKAGGDREHPKGSFTWPQRAMIIHSNRDPWGRVGERNVHGRWFIPPVQNFYFTLQPGDYVVGELYTEIC